MSGFGLPVGSRYEIAMERPEGALRIAIERSRLLYYLQQIQHLLGDVYNTRGLSVRTMDDQLLIKGKIVALSDINDELCRVFTDNTKDPTIPVQTNQLFYDFHVIRSLRNRMTDDHFIYERRHVYRGALFKVISSTLITQVMKGFYASVKNILLFYLNLAISMGSEDVDWDSAYMPSILEDLVQRHRITGIK